MRTLNDLLRTHPIFHDFSSSFIADIAECSQEKEFEPDQYIFWSGHEADYFYILREGAVALQARTPDKGMVTVETLHNGDVMGWSWLFPPYKWHYDAQALEPTTAVVIDARCIKGKCESNHELGYELMLRFGRIVVDRLMATRMRMLDIFSQTK